MKVDVMTGVPRQILSHARVQWIDDAVRDADVCEGRRRLADRDTGTISAEASLYLRALAAWAGARIAVEIGTFIGTSATALAHVCQRVYTCDGKNDCFPSTKQIVCFPKSKSTTMLRFLAGQKIRANFFFVDGRIRMEDLSLIPLVAEPGTVFAFDDFEDGDKGQDNIDLLQPFYPEYVVVPPPQMDTTIAAFVPKVRL